MTVHEQMLDLVDLYALDALEGAELADFQAHLDRCEMCQRQLDLALTVTASLVADDSPPVEVWPRIVTEIRRRPASVTQLPGRRRLFLTLTAVAAAAAIGLGAVLVSSNSVGAPDDVVTAADEAAADPESIVADFVVDGVAVARVVVTGDGVGYVIPTGDLPQLDESRTYQLWVINEEGALISGGVLGNAPRPSFFTWTDGVSGFALTRETAGGVTVSEGDVVAVVTDV